MHKFLKTLILFTLVNFAYGSGISESFYRGMEFYNKAKYKKAIKTFRKIIKKYPEAPDLGRVYAQIGKSYEKLGKHEKAFKAYEDVFIKAPDYPSPEELLEREFKIAEFFEKEAEKSLLGMDLSESGKTAMKIYERVAKNFPFGQYADKSLLKVIKLKMQYKKYEDALNYIKLFKKTYENSSLLDEVSFLNALIFYKQIKRTDYDQTMTKESLNHFREYVKLFPTGDFIQESEEKLSELNNLVCEQMYKTGEFYLKNGNRNSAMVYFKDIVVNFPNTGWADQASRYLE